MFQEALLSKLPDTILTIFEEAVESANKGLVNWIFKHSGMKLLSVLSLPYTLPVEIIYATFTKYVLKHFHFFILHCLLCKEENILRLI
jgi:hypothetical protein